MLSRKRVLIVDDDQTVLYMLEHSLSRLGADYEIHTAMDSTEALQQVEKQSFDLVVADYMMPKITGVDLATAIHKISPDTQVVLMTAYGTSRLRDTSKIVGIDGYLDKPFTVDEIHRVIQKTIRLVRQEKAPADSPGVKFSGPAMREQLEILRINTNARLVLLLSVEGEPVQVVGRGSDVEVVSIGLFVAKNFAAATELASMLGSRSIFKSSYHEGTDQHLYVCEVNKQYLLAVLFETKPGVVWFYAKQAAAALADLLEQAASN